MHACFLRKLFMLSTLLVFLSACSADNQWNKLLYFLAIDGNTYALEDLTKSAQHSDAAAQFWLGFYYYHKDQFEENVYWYTQSAKQGNQFAQYNVGVAYKRGQGVPRDYHVAVTWFRYAAAQGNALAQYNLGAFYAFGQGVPQDYRLAVAWFMKAAAQDFVPAQYNMASAYYSGSGVPQDYAASAKWMQKAAVQDYAPAEFYLGLDYFYG